jgi:hypothetical protein
MGDVAPKTYPIYSLVLCANGIVVCQNIVFLISNSLISFFFLTNFAFLQVNFKNFQVFLILPFAVSNEGWYSLNEYLIQT